MRSVLFLVGLATYRATPIQYKMIKGAEAVNASVHPGKGSLYAPLIIEGLTIINGMLPLCF
jgi:hypothetical protein